MKKTLTIIMTLVLVFSLGISAFAVPPPPAADITVSPVKVGTIVNAYKIISATIENPGAANEYVRYDIIDEYVPVLRTVLGLAGTATETDILLAITNSTSTTLAADIAEALETYVKLAPPTTPTATGTSTTTSLTLPEVELGYYLLLDVTTYTDDDAATVFPMLVMVLQDVTINIKTTTETVPEKTADDSSYSIGQTVTYTATVEVPQFDLVNYVANTIEYVITDAMGTGLEFASITSVKVGGVDLVENTNYTLDSDTTGFTMTFGPDATIGGLLSQVGKELEIIYTATVTADAADDEGLINEVGTGYIEDDYTGDDLTVYTYGIIVDKIDEYENELEDVKFQLYNVDPVTTTGATPLKFSKASATAPYILSASGSADLETDANGNITIWGLKAGTYWLVETETLDGYNLLADPVEITITPLTSNPRLVDDDDDLNAYYDLTVINYTGIELPSTGGVGTVLFTILGLGLMAGAVVVLVLNKKRVFGK